LRPSRDYRQPLSSRFNRLFSACLTAPVRRPDSHARRVSTEFSAPGSPVKAVGSGSRSGFVTSFSGFVTPLLPLFFENPAPILLKQQAI
jgi:hypothetical protein